MMKNTARKKTPNMYGLARCPLFFTLMILSASLVIDSSHAQMSPDVQVTKIHQKFVEDDKAAVAFTICSGNDHLEFPKIAISSDLHTKNLSLKHDLRPNTCIGGTTVINVHNISTITASMVPTTENIIQNEKTTQSSEKLVYQGISDDGSLKVEITTEKPVPEKSMKINLKFIDMLDNPVKNVNYDIIALQENKVVLSIRDLHSAYGSDIITTNRLLSDSAVEIDIMIHGIGLPGDEDRWTGPKGEVVMFHVIPEFGTIATMILVTSILGILILSMKFRSLTFMKIQQ